MRIEFRVKAAKQFNRYPELDSFGDKSGRPYVQLPADITRYADKNEARRDSRFSAYANSDLWKAVLLRALRDSGLIHKAGECWRVMLDDPRVSVDESGFLATVSMVV